MKRYYPLIIVALMSVLLLCSCSVKSKSALISYAKQEFGDCEFVKEEVKGSGNSKVRTVYLIDNETGIEYKVISRMQAMGLDGSTFGYSEYTISNFPNLYWDYVIEDAEDDLDKIAEEYDADLSGLSNVVFYSRPEPGQAEAVAEAVYDVIKDHDVKDLLNPSIAVYAENEVYLGVLTSDTGTWNGNDPYKVIDYVQSVFPEAEYKSDIYGSPEWYVTSEDMDELKRLGAKVDNSSDVQICFFSDPQEGTIVAFDLDKIGLDGVLIAEYEKYGPGDTLDCDALGIHP